MDNIPYKKKDYTQSQSVTDAYNAMQQHNANKPGDYNSKWQGTIDDTINKILNREKFSYDLNGDALYQQYKDQYTTQGKLAMMNTMGQAAAMTGGYGSSYSQAAGQQAYQGYLQQLNEVVPQLYQMAYDRYNQEGQDMYSQYSMLSAQDQSEYGRHRDTVADYYTDRDYLTGIWNSERDFDYGQYQFDTDMEYNAYRDQVKDAQWQADFDEAIRQYNEQLAYTKDRDAIEDKRYEDSVAYSKERDAIEDKRYEDSVAYGKERDAIEDKRYEDALAYDKERDAIEDKRYEDSVAYGKERDAIEDQRYADSVAYNKDRDAIEDQRYEDAKQDKIDAENKAKNYDIAMNLIAAGEEVPYEVQKIAGLSNTEISAFRKIYSAAGGATSDPTKVSDLTQMADKVIEAYENYGPEAAAAVGYMYEQNGYADNNLLSIILSAVDGAEAEEGGATDTYVEPLTKPNGETVEPDDETEKEKNKRKTIGGGGRTNDVARAFK
jgi:hypothetical protein